MSSLADNTPEFGNQNGGQKNRIFVLLAVLSALAVPAIVSRINPNGLGSYNDIPVEQLPSPIPDLNMNIGTIVRAISSLGIDTTQIIINPLSSDITEVELPGGLADLPVFNDEATNIPHAGSPILQQLIERGAVVLVDRNTGVDYKAAFNQLPNREGAITVKSRSGKDITIQATKDYIRVNDAYYETPAQMWANLTPQGSLQLGIYTRSPDNGEIYHPDLYAGEFYDAAIEYFGDRVTGIEGTWNSSSTNTKVVNELLLQGTSLENAIRETFTGRYAIKNGYSEVVIENVEPDLKRPGLYKKIRVIFKQPQPTSQTPRFPSWPQTVF